MLARWATSIGIALIIGIGPNAAFAGIFVAGTEATVRPTKIQAVLNHARGSTTIIERWTVRSNARSSALLLPFPSHPDIVVDAKLSLDEIDDLTSVKAPYNHAVRRDLFGPSNVTILLDNLVDTPKPKTPPQRSAERTLKVADYEVFLGNVQTSTITGKLVLPGPMHRWFQQRGFQLSERAKASIAGHLNRGWVVAAIDLDDPTPNINTAAATPALKFRFSSKEAVLPLMRQPEPLAAEPNFDIWAIGSSQLSPSSFTVKWEHKPWATDYTKQPSRFVAVYGRKLYARDPLTSIAKKQFKLRLPPTPHIVRYHFRHGAEVWDEKVFGGTARTINVPGFGQRGRLLDIILCVLLGLTPLLFTPESWFLLWLSARGQTSSPSSSRQWSALWGVYALIVAVYWALTLDGVGRVAATAPLLIGLVQLFWPTEPKYQEFVRVQFKDPRKKAAQSAERA